MEAINQDIEQIKDSIISHNKADDERFSSILDKLDKNHDIHIRNEEILKQILAQATKTNGRVTNLEETCSRLDKGNALLHQIVSQQHNQYENFVTQQEKTGSSFVSQLEFKPIKNLVTGGVALVLTAVVGALLSVVIIKTK